MVENGDEDEEIPQNDTRGSDEYGGALWDIFRRQDVPKLTEYIKKHLNEFRGINNAPVRAVSIIFTMIIVVITRITWVIYS